MTLADIMTSETNVADVAFLIALILAAIAGILALLDKAVPALVPFAIAAVAFGLMAL